LNDLGHLFWKIGLAPRWFSRETAAKYIAARLASCRQRKPKAGATQKSGGKPPHSKG